MAIKQHVALGLVALLILGLGGCGKDNAPGALPISQIQFALQPRDVPEGTAFNVTVVFLNELGHLVQIDAAAVAIGLATNPAGGTLMGTTTASSKLGVAYFFDSLSIATVGEGYSLGATAIIQGKTLTAVSDTFAITTPTQLAFSFTPTGATEGTSFGLKVEARDDDDKRVPIDGLDVTITIENNPTGGTLGGTTTTSTKNGIALFSNLNIDMVGPGYTLRATAGLLTTVSGPFDVTPAPGAGPLPAVKVVFTSVPATVTAGTPFMVTAELRDALDNVVTTAMHPVTVTLVQDGGGRLMHASGWPPGNGNAILEYIDPSNGSTVTSLANPSLEVNGLGFEPNAGVVLGGGWEGNILTYDPVSGNETLVGGGASIHGYAWDAPNNRMLAVTKDDNSLYSVDALGTLTFVNTLSGSGGVNAFNGLSADPTTGTIYGVVQNAAGNRALCTVDPTTGTVTEIGNVDAATASIAFHPNGTLYATIGHNGNGSLSDGTLCTVNLNTAAMTTIGAVGDSGDGAALAFVGSTFVGTTTQAPVNGVATFTDLQLDTPGAGFQLGVNAPGLTGDTSAAFTVDP